MTLREARKAAVDLLQLYSFNRRCSEPFNLTLCSLVDPRQESTTPNQLTLPLIVYESLINNRSAPMPCEYTPQSVSDVFPLEQVVYLSPEGEEELETLDEDTVYVIGVFVDKECQPGISAERARQLGVRSARFPVRVRLFWDGNEKPLHLEQCLRVLHHVRNGRSWREAISRVNTNFVVETDDS
ncbi:mitochondrial ribonuclease P protein 1-like [Tropilaelaps mercedesae]|uniref:Mitochondrial ribonuclease P protein 1-like n=1 Tax=Tropilaelaps mercedesae TaxID=418985 RepID=A0A1V9X8W1_9ACAR|nr:mitochondrial ribonuclease P protein 1-like [Tropilaelaps mercedesae]